MTILLIKELEARGGGFRRLSPGSVYPTLQMLEESGYLTSEQIEGKRVYTIAQSGKQLLSDRHEQSDSRHPDDRFTQGKPSELIELRRTLTELNDAVTQVARSAMVMAMLRSSSVQGRLVADRFKYDLLAPRPIAPLARFYVTSCQKPIHSIA